MIIVDKQKCTACGACLQKCPTKCISLEEDENGFLFPNVDTLKCVNCGLCNAVCPIEKKKDMPVVQNAYAVVCNDKEALLRATSGGAFGAIAEYVLSLGGVVYGCAYTEHLKVAHIRVDNYSDLERINGSKYVQSDTLNTFKLAETDLKNGKLVLYSGTPCQIAGLNNYLNKDYENLITADIICHGVPSQAYFDKYISYFEEENKVTLSNYNFRSKRNNRGSYAGVVCGTTSDGNDFEKKLCFFSEYFYYYFLSGDLCRESCYSCAYANLNREGDFTLGDFWGAEGQSLPFTVKNGCSLVLVNSEKAKDLLEKLKIQYKEVALDVAVKGNEQLRKPSKMSQERVTLLKEYREMSAREIQKNFKSKNKLAIIKSKLKYSIPHFVRHILLKLRYKLSR